MPHLSLSVEVPIDVSREIDTIPEAATTMAGEQTEQTEQLGQTEQPAEQCGKTPVVLFTVCAAGTTGSFLVPDPFTDMSGLFVCPGTHLIAITQEQANGINPSDIVIIDATIGVPLTWLIWLPAIMLPACPAYAPCTLDDVYPQEQEEAKNVPEDNKEDEETVVSHSYREFPRTVWLAFELWGEKRNGCDASICEPCKNLQNVSYDDDGALANVFCSSCCIIISRMPENKCDRGTPECRGWRWVNGLGEVSMACHGCHEYENSRRRKEHQRGRRRRRRSDRANQLSAAQVKKAIAPLSAAEPTRLMPVSVGVWEITRA